MLKYMRAGSSLKSAKDKVFEVYPGTIADWYKRRDVGGVAFYAPQVGQRRDHGEGSASQRLEIGWLLLD